MLSDSNQIIINILEKGYTIDKKGIVYTPKGIIKTLNVSKHGYKRFTYRINGKPRNVHVHKIQAYIKYGNLLFTNVEVRHLNGIPSDNSFDNIVLGTHSDNMLDKCPIVRRNAAIIASRKANTRTKEERIEIYEALKNGESYNSIFIRLGVARGTLSFMKNSSIEYKEYLNQN